MKNNNVSLIFERCIAVSFVVFGLYLFIPERLENYPPILLIVFSFLYFLSKKGKHYHTKEFIITTMIFVVFLISCFFSDNLKMGFKKMETMTSLIAFPLAFFIFIGKSKLDYKRLFDIFQKVFFVSCTVYSLVVYNYSLGYRNPKFPHRDAAFYRNVLSDVPLIGEHPIYVSLLISMAFIIGFFLYDKKRGLRSYIKNLLIFLAQLILIGFLLIIMSKGVILALVVSLGVLIFTVSKKKTFWLATAIFSIVILIFSLPKENNRFSELFTKKTFDGLVEQNSTSKRIKILECNIDLVKKSPVLGYGIGDVQNQLNNCYNTIKGGKILKGLNSHNQYFLVWLATGIIGLIVFLFVLGYYFKIAMVTKDFLFLVFLVLFSIVFLFENILIRQTGVIIFAFIMNGLTLKNINQNSINPQT